MGDVERADETAEAKTAAFAPLVPQLIFVALLQGAVSRRTGARVRVLRKLGIAMIDRTGGADDERRIDPAPTLDMGIFNLKFTMNFLDESLHSFAAGGDMGDRRLARL